MGSWLLKEVLSTGGSWRRSSGSFWVPPSSQLPSAVEDRALARLGSANRCRIILVRRGKVSSIRYSGDRKRCRIQW
jgi:hypothetical protein